MLLVGVPELVRDSNEVASEQRVQGIEKDREEVAHQDRVVVDDVQVWRARHPVGNLDADAEGSRERFGHAGKRRADGAGEREDDVFPEQLGHRGDDPERLGRVGGDRYR